MKHRQLQFCLGVCGLTALTATAAAADPNDVFAQSRSMRRQFARHSVSAVSQSDMQQADQTLSELIEQVLSLQPPVTVDAGRSDHTAAGVPVNARQPINQQQTDATKPQSAAPDETTAANADTEAERTARLLEMLSAMENPETVPHPMELADSLYRAGKPDLAVRYYEAALKNTSEFEHKIPRRAWLLFQLGNCLRRSDPPRAASFYEQLIRTAPSSPWTPAAQARISMLNWLDTHASRIEENSAVRSAND